MEQKEIHALSSYNRNENDKRCTNRNNNRSCSKGPTNSSNGHSKYQQHDSRRIISKPQLRWGYKKDGGQTCHYSGYSSTHPTCPARGQVCRNCHNTNHFARVCNSKPVRQICFTYSSVSLSTSSYESVFMIIPPTSPKTPKVTALVNDSPVAFVLDTGTSINIISGRVYNGLKHRPAIHCTTTRLFVYRSQPVIPLRGFIDTTMKFRRKCCRAKIFVVDDESPLLELQNLLSAHSAEALGITFNFTFHVSVPIPDKFPSLFDGKIRKISGVIINVHIESSVSPVTQRHCRIPFHGRKGVEAELKRLREMDVIEEITGPTPWVSPVVVVPQKTRVSVFAWGRQMKLSKGWNTQCRPWTT